MNQILNLMLVVGFGIVLFSCAENLDLAANAPESQSLPEAGSLYGLTADTEDVNIDAANLGKKVEPFMFGAVFEGHRLDIDNTTVQASLNNLNLTFLRYPGGTFADREYHYIDCENGVEAYPGEEVATKHLDFLNYCQSHNIEPQLIIPSRKYAYDFAAGRAYAKQYLSHVNDTLNIAADVKYWNLGNEDNLDSIDFNYPLMARHYTNDMTGIDPNIYPTVNWKWNKPQHAETIADVMGNAPYTGIFTSILHPSLSVTEDQMLQQLQQGINKFPAGKRNFQVGAWNVPRDTDWAWMRSVSYMNRRFATLVRAGASIACYWPMKTGNPDRQDRLTNGDGSLAPCGQLFNWLAVSAKGKKIVEGVTESTPLEVTAYRNVSGTTLVVFVCGMNADIDSRVKLKISNFNVQSATGMVLSESDNQTGEVTADVRTIYPSVNTSTKQVIFGINKLSKWEVARIIITTTP